MDNYGLKRFLFLAIPVLGVLIILTHWFLDFVKPNNLVFSVNKITEVNFFETRYLYFYAHLFAFIPVFCLSFDKKVAYYTKWRFVFPAIIIVAIPFWIWDVAKTENGVWGFNPNYYTHLFINLPIEEWLFFITFPWASVFIYECLNVYFPVNVRRWTMDNGQWKKNWGLEDFFTALLILFFFIFGFIYWGHLYTFTTFVAAGMVLLWQFIYGDKMVRIKFYRMFPISTIPFILINSIFTGAFTKNPIVVYNPDENIGSRFFTIPYDDFVYNFVLSFSVVVIYSYRLSAISRQQKKNDLKFVADS